MQKMIIQNRFFDHEPETWQQLEEMVEQAFSEMGYESHRNYCAETIRGNVAIDVFARDERTSIPTIIICECKHWDKPVSQQVVYAFRSVCADIGAHYGLIISKKGFQSGAFETRESTNIHLLNFSEFQEKFFNAWREGVFIEIVRMRDNFLIDLYKSKNFGDVFQKYTLFDKVSDYFISNNQFPISITDPRGDIKDLSKVTINTPREYFKIAKEAFSEAKKI
jgi:hypothetical protein